MAASRSRLTGNRQFEFESPNDVAPTGWPLRAHLLSTGVVVLIGVFYLLTIRQGQEAGDASIFLNHAINISEGHPYTQTGFTANPDAPGIGGITSYPPGLPLVFAVVYSVAGFDVDAFKMAMVLMFTGALFFFSLLLSRRLTPGTGILVLAVVGLNPYFWDIKEALVSHIPFLFWAMFSLWLIDRLYQQDGKIRIRGAALAIFLGITMVMAMITRSVGIAIPAALGLFDLWHRGKWYPSWRVTLPLIVFGMLFLLQRQLLPAGSASSYLDAALFEVNGLFALIRSIFANAKNYVVGCITNTLLDNGRWPILRYLLAFVTLLLAGCGYLWRVWRQISVVEFFVVTFSAIILVWPFLMIAYMIPIYFLFFYYAGVAIDLVTTDRTRLKAVIGFFVVLVFGMTYAGAYQQHDFRVLRQNVASDQALLFYEFVQERTESDALFISREAADFALYAKRRAMPPLVPEKNHPRYAPEEAIALFRFFEEADAKYIVTGPRAPRYHPSILPLWYLARDYPDRFSEIYTNREFGLYEFVIPQR